MKELLTPDGEHHEIGDGGWLMMTKMKDPPLWSPKQAPDWPPDEEQEVAADPYHKTQ